MVNLGLDTDGVIITQQTVTDSWKHLPQPVRIAADYASTDWTSRFSVSYETVFRYLNRDLPSDTDVTGTIEGVIDDKIIIDVDTHESSIGDEYGHNKLVLGHEFWVKNFGGEAVKRVSEETDRFGNPIVKVTMFNVLKLTRDLSDQIDTSMYGYTTKLYAKYDGDREAVFSHMMADPYCLASLDAAAQQRENERAKESSDATENRSTTTAGLERNKDRTTKYET